MCLVRSLLSILPSRSVVQLEGGRDGTRLTKRGSGGERLASRGVEFHAVAICGSSLDPPYLIIFSLIIPKKYEVRNSIE